VASFCSTGFGRATTLRRAPRPAVTVCVLVEDAQRKRSKQWEARSRCDLLDREELRRCEAHPATVGFLPDLARLRDLNLLRDRLVA
jgi:hypothetical protein